MKSVHFIKSPGYTYGLFFVFVLYFNKDIYYKGFVSGNKKTDEDIAYFDKVLAEFGEISNELLPFFYLKENTKCFMTTFYFNPYKESFVTTYGVNTVQEALQNYDIVFMNLMKFYFPDITETEVEECKNSVKALNNRIKSSQYNHDVKNSLYAFFLDPIPTIQKLSYELMTKEFLLSKWYDHEHSLIAKWQNELDLERLTNNLYKFQIDITAFDEVYISNTAVLKDCIKAYYCSDKVLVLIGSDSEASMEYLLGLNAVTELNAIGSALSEKNRIEILDFIDSRQEVTIRDIISALGITATNAYYHLSLMIKANVIESRSQGRTVLYSINRQTFDNACRMLSKYATKAKGG